MLYLVDLLNEIGEYYIGQYITRNDYFSVIKTITNNININLDTKKDKCEFIDEKKLNKKIDRIYIETKILQDKFIKNADKKTDINEKKSDYKQAGINQLQIFIDRIFKLKLKDFVLESDLKKNIFDKLRELTQKKDNDITIEDLYTYFNTLNSSYFTGNINDFIQNVFTNNTEIIKKKINDYTTLLKNLSFKYIPDKSIPDRNIYANMSILFSNRNRNIDINYNQTDDKIKNPFTLSSSYLNFEQSDIINYPTIRIFCTDLSDIEKNLFNRFTYFHEIGHSYVNNIGIVKINNKDICLREKNTKNLCSGDDKIMFSSQYNLSNEFENHYKTTYNTLLKSEFKMINEIIKNNDFIKYLDLLSDILAFNVIIKDLESLGKTREEIFDYCIDILKSLSGDISHFDSDTRILLNVYLNPLLKNVLEDRVKTYEIQKNIDYDKYKKFLENIKSKNIDRDISYLDDIDIIISSIEVAIENDMISSVEVSKIFDTHMQEEWIENEDNYNKFKQFIEDVLAISVDKNNLNSYKKKYLKYKKKYLELKKSNFIKN